MDDTETMERTSVAVDGADFLLAQDQDVAELRSRIEEAAATPGRFVDFVIVGNQAMSVLITATSRVSISTDKVQYDARDTGDLLFPYEDDLDLL